MMEVSAAAIGRLAQSSPWPRGSCRVFIAPTPVVYGLSRIFQTLAADEDEGLVIFHSASEANAWLQRAGHSSADATPRPGGGSGSQRADT